MARCLAREADAAGTVESAFLRLRDEADSAESVHKACVTPDALLANSGERTGEIANKTLSSIARFVRCMPETNHYPW